MGLHFKLLFRAFKYKNFRLYFGGQGISQIGAWIQQTAMSWLVYRLTGSAAYLGVIGFASQIPTFLIGPFAGVVVDKKPRYKILVITQLLAMVQAMVLAYVVLSGNARMELIIPLAVFQGIVNAFDMPARQTFVVELVDAKEERGNAIALNSMMFNVARIVGPSIAGFLIAGVGEGMCFLVNAISFIGVIATLALMRLKKEEKIPAYQGFWERFKEGFSFAFQFAPIRATIILVAINSFIVFPYTVLMSAFAKDVLHGDAGTLGLLMGAMGVGALTGALILGMRQGIKGMGMYIFFCSITFGLGLIGLSFSKEVYFAMPCLVITGFGMIGQMASCNTILQTLAGDVMRGRVMSLYNTAFIGMMPLGSLVFGTIAEQVGVATTFLISGILCLITALVFFKFLPKLRMQANNRLQGESE